MSAIAQKPNGVWDLELDVGVFRLMKIDQHSRPIPIRLHLAFDVALEPGTFEVRN